MFERSRPLITADPLWRTRLPRSLPILLWNQVFADGRRLLRHGARIGSDKGPLKPALRRIFDAIRRNGPTAIHDSPGVPLQTIPDRQG
jgi:hypothetical protein